MSDHFPVHYTPKLDVGEAPSSDSSLRIGVMGYYGFGNLGDEMLLSAIRLSLAPHRVIAFPTAFLPTEDALDRLNGFDYLILGGGGLFNRLPVPPFDTFDHWASQLQTPISVLGLGVEQLDRHFIPATHRLVEQADFFIVRDAESQRLIGHPKVQVAPDLTFYQPLPNSQFNKSRQESLCGVNLRPLHQDLSKWIGAISALPCRKVALPFSSVPTYDDREPLTEIVPSCPDQIELTIYKHLDVVIGTAFHSIVFAVQAGIPVIAINYHPKVRRLMEELGLEDFVLEWDESQQLRSRVEQALADRNRIRLCMLDYTGRAHRNVGTVLSDVRATIEIQPVVHDTDTLSILTEPMVTVFVLCHSASEADIATTLTSCRNQTYSQIEIVLVDCPKFLRMEQNSPTDSKSLRYYANNGAGQDKNNLFSGSGVYVSWVGAGAWFAEDAVALLVRNLVNQPDVAMSHSNYFITSSGNIFSKIELRPVTQDGFLPVGPCFLARRSEAATLWYKHGFNFKDIGDSVLGNKGSVHLTQPLLYRPATDSERYFYLAAAAYGRGQIVAAQELLAQAIEMDPDLTGHTTQFEQGFRALLNGGGGRVVASDPATYLLDVCGALPTATMLQRTFARRFRSRAYLELAFILHEQGERHRTRRSLLNAFRYDPALLSNRGALWLLAETFVGHKIVEMLRRMRQYRRNRQ